MMNIKVFVVAMALVPFIATGETQAADVQIFVRNTEHSNLNLSSHLHINQFVQPRLMVWVWTPHGWVIQATRPVYYRSNLHLQGYCQLVQRRENIKQILIRDADCVYILEDGTIKIYDRGQGTITSSSKVPNYAAGLGRIDAHYRSRSR